MFYVLYNISKFFFLLNYARGLCCPLSQNILSTISRYLKILKLGEQLTKSESIELKLLPLRCVRFSSLDLQNLVTTSQAAQYITILQTVYIMYKGLRNTE